VKSVGNGAVVIHLNEDPDLVKFMAANVAKDKPVIVAGDKANAAINYAAINEIYSAGCPATIAKLPKDGFVVFVCATGARAGEMYFGLKDDCKIDMKRFAFLDAEVAFAPGGPVVKHE